MAQLTEVAAFTVHFICSKRVRIISDWFCLITNHGVNPGSHHHKGLTPYDGGQGQKDKDKRGVAEVVVDWFE